MHGVIIELAAKSFLAYASCHNHIENEDVSKLIHKLVASFPFFFYLSLSPFTRAGDQINRLLKRSLAYTRSLAPARSLLLLLLL